MYCENIAQNKKLMICLHLVTNVNFVTTQTKLPFKNFFNKSCSVWISDDMEPFGHKRQVWINTLCDKKCNPV